MTQSRTILAAAALTGLGAIMASWTVAPFEGSAHAATSVEERIELAFATVPETDADPAIEAAAVRVQKGDLLARPGCFGEKWPNFTADCVMKANGSASRPVRMVTIGYQSGEATTVLVRMPAPQLASR
jgi:hypothetical protein